MELIQNLELSRRQKILNLGRRAVAWFNGWRADINEGREALRWGSAFSEEALRERGAEPLPFDSQE